MTPAKKMPMQIGETARRAGATIRTVRYYLQQGLIGAAERSRGGFYLFDEETVDQIGYILRLRELGLSLGEIKQLIDVRRKAPDGETASHQLRDRLAEQLAFTEQKIAQYQALQREISETLGALEKCAGCRSKPGRAVCASCSAFKNLKNWPAPLKAIY